MTKELRQELRDLILRRDLAAAKCESAKDEAWNDFNDAHGKILIRMEDNWREFAEAYLARED